MTQMTHWDMLNKENSNLVAFINMSQCGICSPVWRFLYHVIAQLQKAHYDLKQNILTDIRIISVEEESNYGLSIHILRIMAAFISPFYANYYGVFRRVKT